MYHVSRNTYQEESGQILILSLVLMTVVTSLVVSLIGYTTIQVRSHRQALNREQGLNLAEAGAELALWKLNNQPGYAGEVNTAYGNGVYTVTVTDLSGSSKLIKVDSYVPNATNPIAHRAVQMTTTIGTINVGFNYGVQVGAGGLAMSNSSRINGNAYTNGDIIGTNSALITGTAIVAGVSGKIDGMDIDGSATAHFIEDSTVGGNSSSFSLLRTTVSGNAVSDSISDCTVNGNATYDTKASCTINGSQTTPNPVNFTDPVSLPLPITDEQINTWEDEATAGGIVGTQNISGSVSLGPKKINGDLNVSSGDTLTLTGTVWVTGDINIDNTAIVKLASSYGSLSGVLMAGVEGSSSAGTITIANSGQAIGSGTTGSYLMLLSQKTGTDSTAIIPSNSAVVNILYAGNGKIELSNSVQLKEVTAYQLNISNSAIVTYESGLANSQFLSGPSGGWELLDQSWQLLQ